jgi:hypothetical protein
MNRSISVLSLFLLAGWLLTPATAFATHPCTSPLVLDLDGHGIATTGEEAPVEFDINGDGELNRIGWTVARYDEAFLWLDLDRDREVDGGPELFGTSTRLPSGRFASNGFEALAVYDRPESGGDEDGTISPRDLVWPHLRLWIDRNHDGASQAQEIFTLNRQGVLSIGLDHIELNERDGVSNLHALRGYFVRSVRLHGMPVERLHVVEDIFFAVFDP